TDSGRTGNDRPLDPFEHGCDFFARHRSLACQSLEPASLRHDFVQSSPGGVVERGHRSSASAGETKSARHDHDQLPGHRANLSIVAAKLDALDAGCGAGDLSGARNSVREFHSSVYDSFRIAFGRTGRLVDAPRFWTRAGC